MSSSFKDLQNKWEDDKKNIDTSSTNFIDLQKKIKQKEKENYFFYYGTISILLFTLISISLFFYYVAPVKEFLSKMGVLLMISGLLFRIFIEIISILKAKKIKVSEDSLKTTQNVIHFHRFRKKIHKIIAPIIITFYTIGFYMITPEFSVYISFNYLLLIDISYLVIAIILYVLIKKGVKKEMQKIADIINLKKQIIE